MTRSTKNRGVAMRLVGMLVISFGLIAALLYACSEPDGEIVNQSATTTTAKDVPSRLPKTFEKMKVDPRGYPHVLSVTGDYPVKVLIVAPDSDYTMDDVKATPTQAANTRKEYPLPKIKRGGQAEWHFILFDATTNQRLPDADIIVFDWWRPAKWTQRFVWKAAEIKPSGCSRTEYHFALQSRPKTVNLTALTKFRVKIRQADGQNVVRFYDLIWGEGDLALVLDELAPGEQVRRVAITASGKYRLPMKVVKQYCLPEE